MVWICASCASYAMIQDELVWIFWFRLKKVADSTLAVEFKQLQQNTLVIKVRNMCIVWELAKS